MYANGGGFFWDIADARTRYLRATDGETRWSRHRTSLNVRKWRKRGSTRAPKLVRFISVRQATPHPVQDESMDSAKETLCQEWSTSDGRQADTAQKRERKCRSARSPRPADPRPSADRTPPPENQTESVVRPRARDRRPWVPRLRSQTARKTLRALIEKTFVRRGADAVPTARGYQVGAAVALGSPAAAARALSSSCPTRSAPGGRKRDARAFRSPTAGSGD